MEREEYDSISFFVPCLNEEGNIGRSIDNIVGVMEKIKAPYEIIVVDDASSDGSVAEVYLCRKRYPQAPIELIRSPFCRGLGRNYFIAAQRARGEYYMLVNGDAAEPLESILTVVSHRGKADAIVPYFGLDESRTLPRRLLSWVFTFLVNMLSGHHLKYYNGPVLHRTENVRMWFAETAGFGYQAELLCRLLDEGITVLEVQVANSDRERGASKALRVKNLLSVANTLFHIMLRRFERMAFYLLSLSNKEKVQTKLKMPVAPDAEQVGLQWEKVKAWTETKTTRSLVARPGSIEECNELVKFASDQGFTILPRGSGYSFADMILNHGQIILDTNKMNKILSWDKRTGRIVAQPGVVVAQILREVLPHRWTLPSCTGGMGVTVAGGVSNNVHGKDSWKLGNFGNHVIELKLLTSSGEIIKIDRRHEPELFRAVIGGIGLLGVIVEVTLQLKRIPSPYVEVTTKPVRDLSESLESLELALEYSDFAVAWVDAFAEGKDLGRGMVETARWIETDQRIDEKQIESSLMPSRYVFGFLPASPTWGLGRLFFRPSMMKIINSAKYWQESLSGQRTKKMLFTDYNFMLNKIPEWKKLYRPYGYVELQPLIPREKGHEALAEMLRMCHDENSQSLLCGIKCHGPDDHLLSFEGQGYSIGIDISLRGRNLGSIKQFGRELYGYVADQGGKAFLAKDEILPRDIFERMYFQHDQFIKVKEIIDPQNLFSSDMYRRLLA